MLVPEFAHEFLVADAFILPLRLGLIKRKVRMTHELVDVRTVGRIMGIADAQSDMTRLALNQMRTGKGLQQRLSEPVRSRAFGRGQVADQKFVAAKTGDDVVVSGQILQLGCNKLQKMVACSMAKRVVDHLEVVQIHEIQRCDQVVVLRSLPHMRQAFLQIGPVRQPCQRIMACKILGAFLGLVKLRDIDLAQQKGRLSCYGVVAAAYGDFVPAQAVARPDLRHELGRGFLREDAHHVLGENLIDEMIPQGAREIGAGCPRGRVAVKRLSVFGEQRDHHRGVHQRFGASERFRLLLVMRTAFAQQRHATVIQPDAAHDNLQDLSLAIRIECPDLRKAHVMLGEILLVLPQALFHRMGHVRAHVACPQLFQRFGIGNLKRLAIGPHNAFFVEIENPDTGVETIVNRKDQLLIHPAVIECKRQGRFPFSVARCVWERSDICDRVVLRDERIRNQKS